MRPTPKDSDMSNENPDEIVLFRNWLYPAKSKYESSTLELQIVLVLLNIFRIFIW